MTQYVLAGFFGSADKKTALALTKNKQHALLNFLYDEKSLRPDIKSAINQLGKLNIYPTEVALDLLVLALMVQVADTRLNRIKTSQDAWTREIKIIVPVSNRELWEKSKDVLEKMLSFLTGDFWKVEFRPRPDDFENLINRKIFEPFDYDGVSLFSGGLDSLIGAINCRTSGKNPLFISHAGNSAVSAPQYKIFKKLCEAYPTSVRLCFSNGRFPQDLFSEMDREGSTRGRSFLFFALAAFAGSGMKKPFDLRVPENGLIALNVPLDPTRLGSLSTRTTHPYYIHRWQELLKGLEIPGCIFNPYWNKTKGEMICECKNQAFLKSVVHLSVSCAHPSVRNKKRVGRYSHCGYCVPCIIRRAAINHASINHAWGEDTTPYSLSNLHADDLDLTKAESEQKRAYQYAIANLKANPNRAAALVHKPGPLLQAPETVQGLVEVYERGMAEVKCLLEGVIATPDV